MSRIETTVVIDRPVEDVWLVLSDPLNLPTWCPEADDVTPLTEGPFSADTRVMVSGRIGPLRFRSTHQVTDFQPHRAIEVRSVDRVIGGGLVTRVDLDPAGSGTRLTATSRLEGPPRWLAGLTPGRQKDRDAFFASLKQSLESHPRPAAASAAPKRAVDPPSRAERDRLERERAPVPDPRLMETPPSVAEEPVATVDRTVAHDAEERASEATERDTEAEEQHREAERQVKEAEVLTGEDDVRGSVSDAIAADDPTVVTLKEDAEADRAASREPAAMLPAATPPAATDGERPRGAHEAVADDDRLMLRLETERGPAASYEIPRSGVTIGRAPENTVRLDDLSVSRRHARISYRQGGYWLSDLKSASGTWVDEKKLAAPRRLASDQIIRIGILRLRVVVGAAGDEMPTNSEPVPASSSALAGNRRRRR